MPSLISFRKRDKRAYRCTAFVRCQRLRPYRLTVHPVDESEHIFIVKESYVDRACLVDTALFNKQILSDVGKDNVARLPRRVALLQRNDRSAEQGSVRLFRQSAGRNINRFISELQCIKVRLKLLIDIPY